MKNTPEAKTRPGSEKAQNTKVNGWGYLWQRYWFIEVNTIQDILDLAKKYKASIIVHRFGPELEIYDGYRE